MKKVNIIGEKAWNVFKDSQGNEIREECTLEEYNSLKLPNPQNPTKVGCTFVYACKNWKYDTASGELEDNCYLEKDGQILVKLSNKDAQLWIPLSVEEVKSLANRL